MDNFTDGWTLKTLKAYIDERDRRYAVERETSQKAVEIAERNAEEWRDNADEWRQAMNEKDRNFVTKGVLWSYVISAICAAVVIMTFIYTVFKP